MPWGDGTGPWWAQGKYWWCRRAYLASFCWRGVYGEPIILTKNEQRKILEEEKERLELELKRIKEKLKELSNAETEKM